MEHLKRLDALWMFLLLVGGLNWACIPIFDTNVLAEIVGTGTALDVIYVLVGVAAVMYLVPRFADEMGHLGEHRAHPRGV